MVFDGVDISDPLYSEVQRIILKHFSKEESSREVRITVNVSTGHIKVSKKILKIHVSDDENPFFFYSLILTEDDYQRLRHSQGILVDFESFPTHVLRLLEQCKDETQSSRLSLLLEEDGSTGEGVKTCLKIVETNSFKYICHLSLLIEPGNDSDIKNLMLEKIHHLKKQEQKAAKSISELEAQICAKNKQLAIKEKELDSIHKKWEEDRAAYTVQSSKKLNEEIEKQEKALLELKIKEQRQIHELEDKYSKSLKEKDLEISRLCHENKRLLDGRTNSDLTISNKVDKIEKMEKEMSQLRSEILLLRNQNSKLDFDFHEKDRLLNDLKTKLSVSEQERKDQDSLINNQQQHLERANEQRTRLEEILKKKEENCQQNQLTIKNLNEDLVKANKVISRLENEMSANYEKWDVRANLIIMQQEIIQKSEEKIEELLKNASSNKEKIKSLKKSEILMKGTVSNLSNDIKKKDETIKENNRVIDCLNKKLLEQSKEICSLNSKTASEFIIPGVTSTPYPYTRNQDYIGVAHSEGVLSPADVRSLDHHENVQSKEIKKQVTTMPVPQQVLSEHSDNIKCEYTPKSGETSSKRSVGTKSLTKQSSFKTPGFKRSTLPKVEATPVPSAYFSK